MEPITLRLSEELIEEIDAAADEAGFASRSEYLRAVLRNHSEHAPNTARVRHEHGATTGDYDRTRSEYEELVARVESLEERVDAHGDRLDTIEGENRESAPSSGASGGESAPLHRVVEDTISEFEEDGEADVDDVIAALDERVDWSERDVDSGSDAIDYYDDRASLYVKDGRVGWLGL